MKIGMAAALLVINLCLAPAVQAQQVTWQFDSLKQIAGIAANAEGHPRVVKSPVGPALQFDGQDDSLFIDGRPLVGASTFTAEVIFRPEGGPFAQRFMHIAETEPATGLDAPTGDTADQNGRFMFEVRVVDGQWYLDTYLKSKAGAQALLFETKRYPLNRWYAVAQTYNGKTYRAYVNGELQGEAEVAFTPHGPGHVRIGARMNRLYYFKGSIAKARFTDRALAPTELLRTGK